MRSWLTGRTTDDRSRDRRGQTNLDFVVGVSLFIVAVIFVWLFLPNLFAPFTASGAHGDSVAADRAANRLANDVPGNGTGPSQVDELCLVSFFNSSLSDRRCGFNNSDPIGERLGLRGNAPVNVTLVGDVDKDGNRSLLYWQGFGRGNQFNETSGSTRLAIGGQHGSQTNTNVARRAVFVDGQRMTIFVRVW